MSEPIASPHPVERIRRADVKTGFRCNNRCLFCVQGEKRHEYGDKSREEIEANLRDARVDADEVVLTGGEVTIRKDLPELVSYAKALGFRVIQVQTNGRMMSSEHALDRLIEAGATEFSPSLHGPNEAIHDGLTRAPGAFRQTVRGIRNARARGVPVLLNSVVTRQNMVHLPAMARLFVRLDVSQYQFAFVHPVGSAGANFDDLVPRFSELQPYLVEALLVGRRAGIPCMCEAVPLCFLPGIEDLAAEYRIPRTRIYDASWVIPDYTEQRLVAGKAKGPCCRECVWDGECEGPWREYPERFGWDEFRPVRRATAPGAHA
jgi:MoaA/NifB/PqqE/SkfB family radical SAM enzyme